METVLDVVVNSQICLNQIREIFDDFCLVFVQKSLQLRDVLKLIEVLFKLSIKIDKNLMVLM